MPLTRAQVQTFVDSSPFNTLLEMRVARVHADGVTLECRLRHDTRNTHGTLHGGVYATLADAAVGVAIAAHYEFKRKATTVEMKVNFFLPILEGKLKARAKLLRLGSSLAVGSVDLYNDQKKLAGAALVTYKLL